jgi:hypothetical protein
LLTKKPKREWTEFEDNQFLRIGDSLFSVLMSIRASNPRIRYDEGSHFS